jgi:hypothetical protein
MTVLQDQRSVRDHQSPPLTPATSHHPPSPPVLATQWPMVGWYQPSQLIRTGIAVAISTIFGRHSDHRLIEALGSTPTETYYDYTCYDRDDHGLCAPDRAERREEIWLDYVGDVGDGWDSTYAIAYYLAQPQLSVKQDATERDRGVATHRGDILIFGGDEVYPTATREAYEQRLLGPYETALRETTGPRHPHVFAIPGNHDWYDSLASFIRLFTSRHWFGGWRTRQHRSYFALRLPQKWWLLGTDVQLGSDIDRPQVEYFERVAKKIEELDPGARIILCHAEPHWVYKKMYADKNLDPAYTESNLALLEKRLQKGVAVFIAGDQHHYRRYEATDGSGCQKITAGGGGAFLHPTHTGRWGTDLQTIKEEEAADGYGLRSGRTFRQITCSLFPTEEESRRLCWRTLVFPYLPGNASRTFGVVTAALYWLSTLAFMGNLERFPFQREGQVAAPCPEPECWWPLGAYTLSAPVQLTGWVLDSILASPLTLWWMLLLIVGFILFTDTHSTRYRWIAGPIHALFHLLVAVTIAIVAITLVLMLTSPAWVWSTTWGGYSFRLDWRAVPVSALIALGGFVVGSFIMGLYLLISLNVFGRHWNEAFSALAIPDWKHFLRLHIDTNGGLTIYPIGIRRVPRRWKARQGSTGPELEPDDPKATPPFLIEEPIKVEGSTTL